MLILVSKYPQTHYKKFSSRDISKAYHEGDGGGSKQKRGEDAEKIDCAMGAKALKQRILT
jgi:hypothetical protein